jgi:hypothetical protein
VIARIIRSRGGIRKKELERDGLWPDDASSEGGRRGHQPRNVGDL